ncbi:MAG: DSD1 family PLP-dependent enzyme [Planctomycetes bacterium]|nr:DSD1 family PLP-dependent enzyme [Planctomycetota bacterium]
MTLPHLGCTKADLDTPSLCVDLDALEFNIAAMSGACRERSIDWRPHSKCHKSPLLAQKLIASGAIGVTCAKLGEAEVMAKGGVTDTLIANLIVGPKKVARLVELRRIADPVVCVDHIDQATAFSKAMSDAGLSLRVIAEVDIGLARVGVAAGDAAVELARHVHELPGLTLAGIMGYEGHLLTLDDGEEKAIAIHAALKVLTDTAYQIRSAGLPCEIVSCGGTGSFKYTVQAPGITEMQAGGGMFMDAFYRYGCQISDWKYALTVLATIVSRPAPDRAIIDAGRKTMDGTSHKPLVFGRDDIRVESLSAEHGALKLDPSTQDLKIGDRLEIIPGYSDMTCVLHDNFLGFRGDKLEVIWPLEGRGRLQ